MNIIDTKPIIDELSEYITGGIKLFGRFPLLAFIYRDTDEASVSYYKSIYKACDKLGISFEFIRVTDPKETRHAIDYVNRNPCIHAAVSNLTFIKDLKCVKDVDALNPKTTRFKSCTAEAIVNILQHIDNFSLRGSHCVIINRSGRIGRPLVNILLNEDATVTVCHSQTVDLHKHISMADVIITAVGERNFITHHVLGSKYLDAIIDAGCTVEDGKVYGDCNLEGMDDYVRNITPVPNGVGPVTIYTLLSHVVQAALRSGGININ